ncbi:protein-tyrosine-phosphatase [uncultured Thiomicrorhabdus sp.]
MQPNKTPPIFPITSIGLGQLTMMPRPRSETLLEDMAYYQKAGITHIVNLLRTQEIERLQLGTEKRAAQRAGINYLDFPVKDMGVPALKELRQFNLQLIKLLNEGAHVAVHCNGGRGRAGTIAVSVMLECGMQLNDALQLAREKRGDIVPVCELQEQFLADYAQLLQDK